MLLLVIAIGDKIKVVHSDRLATYSYKINIQHSSRNKDTFVSRQIVVVVCLFRNNKWAI